MFLFGVALLRLPWWVCLLAGLAVAAFQGVMWREGGPGYRLRQAKLRRFPER
jgi:hypothetical protein